MKPVLVVDQAPSSESDPRVPLSGRSGRKLLKLVPPSLKGRIELRNLVDRFAGKNSKADLAPFGEFEEGTLKLKYELLRGLANGRNGWPKVVVLLGKTVARFWGAREEYFSEQITLGMTPLFVVPHPSRVSRWWNDERSEQKFKEFFEIVSRRVSHSHGHDPKFKHEFNRLVGRKEDE